MSRKPDGTFIGSNGQSYTIKDIPKLRSSGYIVDLVTVDQTPKSPAIAPVRPADRPVSRPSAPTSKPSQASVFARGRSATARSQQSNIENELNKRKASTINRSEARTPQGVSVKATIKESMKPWAERNSGLSRFEGFTEQQWLDEVNEASRFINAEGRGLSESELKASLRKRLNMRVGRDSVALERMIRSVRAGKKAEDLSYGVPHTHAGEGIWEASMNASGRKTNPLNDAQVTGTDLITDIDGRLTYVDVQNTYNPNTINLGIYKNIGTGRYNRDIRNKGKGILEYKKAAGNDTLFDISNRVTSGGAFFGNDKLTQGNRGLLRGMRLDGTMSAEFGKGGTPLHQKDIIVGGTYKKKPIYLKYSS